MTDPTPTVLGGRYELRGLIGRGGMAEVHRGYDRNLDREVAVKVMHGGLTAEVDRQRFASETRLLAGLNDPHLVMLLDAGVDEVGASRPWLVMELVDGPTLASRLVDGPLPAEEVAAIGADLAAALAHVHARGIVHRDVKPANVLLTARGGAKLADFGVARLRDEQSGLTAAGHTIGTAAYLAPEQVRGLPVNGASDVYALGLLLLEALTGRRAYPGAPAEAALARLQRRPLIPVSLGAGWVRLLDAMTAMDPAERPGADEVAHRLTSLRRGAAHRYVAVAADSSDPTATSSFPAVAGTAARRPQYRPLVLAAAGVAAVVALGVTVGLVTKGADSAPPAAGAVAGVSSTPQAGRTPGHKPTSEATPSATRTHAAPTPVSRPVAKPKRHHPAHRVKHHAPHRVKHHAHHHKPGKGHGHGHGKGHGHKK